MKKRKSPIVLVTLLAIMASVAFGLQYAGSRTTTPGQEQAPQAPPVAEVKPIGESRTAESAQGVGSGLKTAMGSPSTPPPAGGPPGGRPGAPGAPGAAGGPMILNPAQPTLASGKPEKPKPNTSSTSTQWYDKESAFGGKD